MRLLLDTQAILLAAQGRLPRTTKGLLLDPRNHLVFSRVSFWEMGIKAARGTLELRLSLSELASLVESELGAEAEPLGIAAIDTATRFPFHHKDPFDRLLAATALLAGCTVVSSDRIFEAYGCTRVW